MKDKKIIPGVTKNPFSEYPKRQYYELLRSRMDIWRSPFLAHWKDLAQYLMPYRQQFEITDNNRGERRNLSIIDSTATLCLRDLAAGLMSGLTSPSRPWFKFTTNDKKLSENKKVKVYLDQITDIEAAILLQSNFYNEAPNLYGDGGAFGTSALYMEEDYDNVVRFYHWPIGSYYLANNDKMRVAVAVRDLTYTVREIVEKFGTDPKTGEIDFSNITVNVQNLWAQGQLEAWVYVTHVIEINPDWQPKSMLAKHKRYRSVWYERGVMGSGMNLQMIPMGPDLDRYLRESGYDYFPVLVYRWGRSGEDIYGTVCPGMEALGDIKQLQMGERRKAQAIEKWVNPPLVGDSSLRSSLVTQVPGGMNWVNMSNGQEQLKPLYSVNPDISTLNKSQEEVRERISRAMYNDLIRMMLDSERKQITATEVEERTGEKEFILGPMMEQLNQGVLDPLIINVYRMANKQGLMPPMPEELKGKRVTIEYVSVMAQARKAVGKAAMVDFSQFVTSLEQGNPNDPSIGDIVDKDEQVRQYADMISIPAVVIRSEDEVAKIRQGRAQQQQAQAAQERLSAGARAAKDLAAAPTDQNNALTQLVNGANAGSLAPQGA